MAKKNNKSKKYNNFNLDCDGIQLIAFNKMTTTFKYKTMSGGILVKEFFNSVCRWSDNSIMWGRVRELFDV